MKEFIVFTLEQENEQKTRNKLISKHCDPVKNANASRIPIRSNLSRKVWTKIIFPFFKKSRFNYASVPFYYRPAHHDFSSRKLARHIFLRQAAPHSFKTLFPRIQSAIDILRRGIKHPRASRKETGFLVHADEICKQRSFQVLNPEDGEKNTDSSMDLIVFWYHGQNESGNALAFFKRIYPLFIEIK